MLLQYTCIMKHMYTLIAHIHAWLVYVFSVIYWNCQCGHNKGAYDVHRLYQAIGRDLGAVPILPYQKGTKVQRVLEEGQKETSPHWGVK